MVELADTRDSKSRGEIRVGSSPTLGTTIKTKPRRAFCLYMKLLSSLQDFQSA